MASKKLVIKSKKKVCRHVKVTSQRQKYIMTPKKIVINSKSSSWPQKNCHNLKKCVKTSKNVMMSKSSPWGQKYNKKFIMTSQLCHDVKKFVTMSKLRHEVKSRHDVNKFVITSKSVSWHLKVRHDVKKCVMTSKICHDVNKFVMTSKRSSWSQTRGLSAWQLRCLIVYATLMMSNCLWYTAKLIPNDLDLTLQCHPRSNVMG